MKEIRRKVKRAIVVELDENEKPDMVILEYPDGSREEFDIVADVPRDEDPE